ncbi:MAG: hypothetical protein ACP5MD_04880 [Verrucomicrobiia bacterium]
MASTLQQGKTPSMTDSTGIDNMPGEQPACFAVRPLLSYVALVFRVQFHSCVVGTTPRGPITTSRATVQFHVVGSYSGSAASSGVDQSTCYGDGVAGHISQPGVVEGPGARAEGLPVRRLWFLLRRAGKYAL